MRTGFFLVTAAVSAFLPLSSAQAREAFTAVLSANGESRTYNYNSIEDAIDSVSGTSLRSLLFLQVGPLQPDIDARACQ